MINCDLNDMVAELGYIQILKPFQVCIAWNPTAEMLMAREHTYCRMQPVASFIESLTPSPREG